MSLKRQGFRYILVGLASNALLYLLYLGLTVTGLNPKTAMTIGYLTGVLQTFVLNKSWTFGHIGHNRPAFFRYLGAYGGCYLVQLSILYIFIDYLGMQHTIVQGVAICLMACLLFILQKYWIFSTPEKHPETKCHDHNPVQ
jgi:putative flippase GtrA